MFKIIGLFGILMGLSACAWFNSPDTPEPTPHERISFQGEAATSSERALCEAAGGTVRRDGLLGWENCIQDFADAGQSCKDNEDCLGRCMVSGEFADMGARSVTGECEATDSPFGCFQTIENGQATAALCVD